MEGVALIEAVNAGGNLGILAVGLAVMDLRGKVAEVRLRLESIEKVQNGN